MKRLLIPLSIFLWALAAVLWASVAWDSHATPYCFEKTNRGKTYTVCSGEPMIVTGDGPGGVTVWARLIGHTGADNLRRTIPPVRHWHPLGGDIRDFPQWGGRWQTIKPIKP